MPLGSSSAAPVMSPGPRWRIAALFLIRVSTGKSGAWAAGRIAATAAGRVSGNRLRAAWGRRSGGGEECSDDLDRPVDLAAVHIEVRDEAQPRVDERLDAVCFQMLLQRRHGLAGNAREPHVRLHRLDLETRGRQPLGEALRIRV